MPFDEYWAEFSTGTGVGYAEQGGAAEAGYNAAVDETWRKVFQIISDHPQMLTREVIRKFEAEREVDKAGPGG